VQETAFTILHDLTPPTDVKRIFHILIFFIDKASNFDMVVYKILQNFLFPEKGVGRERPSKVGLCNLEFSF